MLNGTTPEIQHRRWGPVSSSIPSTCKEVFEFSTAIFLYLMCFMSRSSHIQSVLIGVEYRNFCQTLYVYLVFQSASSSIGKLRSQKNNKTFNKSHFNLFD